MKNWLPIRHDYLVDNFEDLLDALSDADYSNKADGLLTETVTRLEEVSDSLLSGYFSHSLGRENVEDKEFLRNIRIVLTSVYASFRLGKDVSAAVVSLLDTLVINKVYQDEDSLKKIRDIIIYLALGIPVKALPYSLKDLRPDEFNLQLFARRLSGFAVGALKGKTGFQSMGSCIFEDDTVIINTVGIDKALESKPKSVVPLSLGVGIRTDDRKKFSDEDFKDQVAFLNTLMQSMEAGGRVSPKIKKSYAEGDELFVRVEDIDLHREKVRCVSLDPAYESLELTLLLPSYLLLNSFTDPYPHTALSSADIVGLLETGDILKVRLEVRDGKPRFAISQTIKEYFDNYKNFNEVYEAIFITSYSGGTRWLTDLGHTVNIQDDKKDREIEEAEKVDGDKAIEVSYTESIKDKMKNTVLNGRRVGSVLKRVDDFVDVIPNAIMTSVTKHWAESCPPYEPPVATVPEVGKVYPLALGHLLSVMAADLSATFIERYLDAVGARMLVLMAGDEHDLAFCELDLAYLRALWAFAQDSGHDWLRPLGVPARLEGLEAVSRKARTVQILRDYKDTHYSVLTQLGNEVDTERLKNLVDASNALSGNIAVTEINRIRRTISKCLGIESIYKEEASTKYWFGEEGDTLEFKTSVVYPPVKGSHDSVPNPNFQIWNILKAVNGFLNTLHGGVLLIGVNDFGNAAGVDSDIRWLRANNYFIGDDIDRYTQYVKLRVDRAFEAYSRKDADTDITATRISYSSFQTEGNTILRVEVKPYELGCVRLKETLHLPGGAEIKRPETFKNAYLRVNNTTEELTKAKREKQTEEKRRIIKDSEQRKQIAVQEALDGYRFIELVKYHSSSRVDNRTVEPVELLPARGLVIGVERGKSDLRVFKLSRCEEVKVTDLPFSRKSTKPSFTVDPFNMLSVKGKGSDIVLRLDRRAWLQIIEMYPFAANFLEADKDTEFPFILRCRISDVRGVGSFCMSVLGHFKAEGAPELEAYIREQCAKFING